MKQTKFYLILLSVLLMYKTSTSQNRMLMKDKCSFELGGGIAAYNGDLIEGKKLFDQAYYSFSAGLAYQFKPKWFVHADFSLLKVGAYDRNNQKAILRDRNLSFASSIEELNLGLEYDVINVEKHKITPYLYGGLGLFHFNPYAYDRLGVKRYLRNLGTEGQGYISTAPEHPFYLRTQIELPFGGGIKWQASKCITLKAEFIFRKTFTDYIDDVSTTYPDSKTITTKGTTTLNLAYRGDEVTLLPYPVGKQRGNPNNKDIYYSGEIKICFKLKK